MLFNSFAFAIFLPVTFALFWLLRDKYRWILLVIASYFFYMCSGPKYGLLIFGISVVSYFSARLLEKYEDIRIRKLILLIVIFICVGLLFFYKYFNFFSSSLSNILNVIGVHCDAVTLNIVLPVGISFYTFQVISYVVDVYKGTTNAEHHFGKYLAFVSFFPQLVAGPIERSDNLLSQINKVHKFDYDQAMYGVKLMLWGYYKKLVIADVLSTYVQAVYDAPYQFKGFVLIIASVFFTIQIYCDFSGYSDIAIGTAKLFGIDLVTNFKSPYFSRSIREFWSRWHISLSMWFRDYVYIPLGGNRVGEMRHSINLMITFLVSGLWHGANWTFIVWGGGHGIAQIIENTVCGHAKESEKRIIRFFQTAMVFSFCTFAWIFFVSNTINDAFYVIRNCLVGITHPVTYILEGFANIGLDKSIFVIVGVCVLIMTGYDYISLKKDFVAWISEKNKFVQWTFYILLGLMIVFLSRKGAASEFIYFQF